jgi:hypothetical protein
MTLEHLSETQLASYSGRTLDPQELLAVDRHLASCDECHGRLSRILPGAGSFESGEEPFHLDYEHLESYVDGKANDIDREIVESHVALCSKCDIDLKDLLEFKQQPVAAVAGDVRTTPWWKQWLPQLPSNPVWATAAVGVIAIVVLGIPVLWWTRSRGSDQAKFASPESARPIQSPEKEQPSPEATAKGIDGDLPPEELRLVLNDAGGQLMLNQSGRLEGLQELPPDLRESVERALATGRLRASPALTGWTTGAGNLRGGSATESTFVPLWPTDVVIETDRPTLRWRALEGAQNYVVTVYDAQLRKVSNSGPVSGTEWTITNSLDRGVTYSWQISAVKDGETVVSPKPPLPEARFRVLDQRAVSALAKLKQSAGSSHLAMGVFYWKHGLLEDAEREFQALVDANPNSTIAKQLLASIRHR